MEKKKKRTCLPMQGTSEMRVRCLGWEDPLEEGVVPYSSILAWRIPKNRGAWRATVHRVAKSHMGLKRLSMHTQQSAELMRQGELFRGKGKKITHVFSHKEEGAW